MSVIPYLSYSRFVSSIDKFTGIRKITLDKIDSLIYIFQNIILNKKSYENANQQNSEVSYNKDQQAEQVVYSQIQNILKQTKLDSIKNLNSELFFL